MQRLLLAVLALGIGWLVLPITALLGERLGDATLPVALLVSFLIGLAAGALLPEAAGSGSSRLRGGLVGAVLFLLATILATVVLWVIVTG